MSCGRELQSAPDCHALSGELSGAGKTMCGLTGFWDISLQNSNEELSALVHHMACTLQHRGPDDGGEWVDARTGIALGFRRLAIIDLSPAGHQPMASASGRYLLIYNGEIYNFQELRREL